MQRFSGDQSFCERTQCFASERNISQGNTILLHSERKCLRANAKFVGERNTFAREHTFFLPSHNFSLMSPK